MIKELIEKLKRKKEELQNTTPLTEPIEEKKINFEILLSQEDNFYKMEISEYISIIDYVDRIKEIDEFGIESLVGNAVLWNSRKQKVNKGTYYVVTNENNLYNILLNENDIKIDIRTKQDDITIERFIRIDTSNNDYSFTLHHHDKTGNTFYTRYFSLTGIKFGKLELTEDEFNEQIRIAISSLESVEGINNIVDINLLKNLISNNIGNNNKML